MADLAVQTFLAGLALAVDHVRAHQMLSDGVRRHLRLRTEVEAPALTYDALTLGTDLAVGDLDPPPPSLTDLVCQAARLRQCRLNTHAPPLPVVVMRSHVQETVGEASARISLRATEAMLDLMQRRGLPHYVRQAELAAMRAVHTIDGRVPGGPREAIAALDDAMDFGLLVLGASHVDRLDGISALDHG